MNRLSIVKGARAGEVIDLAAGGLTLGGDTAAANVAFEDPQLSSVHCRVAAIKGGGFGIQDLGTKGGTFVNGKRVTAARLSPGDRIALGSVELVFESSEAAAHPAVHSTVHSAVRTPTPLPVKPEPAAARTPDPDLTGQTLGGYQVEKVLGRGGMGTVYRATQNSLHRTVALKVLSPQLAHDPKFVELFLKEARAAAQLHHPNVVTIFDVGSAGNTHYFSMEVFDGGSVEQWLRREKKLPVERALTMARDAAKALEFAESKHILHRDVKPDNLMVTAQGVVKLADLGIAARRGEETTGRFGTPHFVAPECIKGASADHRSDLYSLGATLFRMLTGRTPFQGANVGEILDAVQRTEAPRLREIDPNIPEGVEAFVAQLLQKDPEKRFARGKEVVAALDALIHPVAAASKVGIWVGVGALVVAGAGVGFFLMRPKETGTTQPTVVRDTATEDRLRSEKAEREKELRNTEGELALAKVSEKLAFADRVAKLDAIAKDFADTPAGKKASSEAERVRHDEAARLTREAEKAKTVTNYRASLEQTVQGNIKAGKFAEALAAPKGLDGYQMAVDDPDAKAAIEVVPERVSAAVESQVKDTLDKALGLRSAGKLDEAETTYKQLAESLRALISLPRDQVGEQRASRFQTLLTSVDGALVELSRGKADFAARAELTARGEARAAARTALDALRAGKPRAAADALAAAAAKAKIADLQGILQSAAQESEAAAALFAKLVSASERKELGAEPFVDPVTGKPCRLVAVEEGGIRLEPKGAPLTAVNVVAFEKLGSGARFAALLARAGAKSPSDSILLARAALASTLAFEVSRLVQYQRSLKLETGAAPPPPEIADDGFQAALDFAQAAGTAGGDAETSSAVASLRTRIEAERAAARKLREGLDAFSSGRYADAERQLSEFSTSARGTIVHLLAADGAPPAGAGR